MEKTTLRFDDASAKILEDYAAEKELPRAGILVLALVASANEKERPLDLIPANELLERIADAFEQNPPSTPEEVAAFAERLRYCAQFTTTRGIPDYLGKEVA